jgi:hypothetical protein
MVATLVTPVAAIGEVESVYRQDGDRLWRALYAFAGNEDVASDAVAEAFAQALRRGSAIRDVRSSDERERASRPLPLSLPRHVRGASTPDGVVEISGVEPGDLCDANALRDGKVLLAGGAVAGIAGPVASAELYDPGSGN